MALMLPAGAHQLVDAAAASDPAPANIARDVQTVPGADIGISRPLQIAYDAATGTFVVAGETISGEATVRVPPSWDPTDITSTKDASLLPAPGDLTATNPEDGLSYRLSSDGTRLEARDGVVVGVYDTSSIGLLNPSSMTFAPSTDITDPVDTHNLFVADAGNSTASGGVTEITLEQPTTTATGDADTPLSGLDSTTATVETATLVQSIATSQWSPPSTDPSGIVWDSRVDELIVVDSEVNETGLFTGANLWKVNRSGAVLGTGATTGYSDEPTGVGLDIAGDTMFITDDTGTRSLYVVTAGLDGVLGTSDDVSDQIDVGSLATDPEDPTYHIIEGVVYFLSGIDREVFRVDPNDGVFGNGDDTITSFDISHLGPTDFEGMTSAPNRGTLYVAARASDQIFEITTSGTLLRTIDVNISDMTFISGLAMAPSSVDPSVHSLWLVDRAADEVNDGMLYEIAVDDLDDPGAGNTAPVANDDSTSTSQDSAVVIDVLENDFDADGDPLSVDNASNPTNGTVAINADDTITYTPNTDFTGEDSFTYQASDGQATSNPGTVTITVTGPNQPPSASDDTASTNQGTPVTIDVLANDTDPHNDPLEVAALTTPSNGSAVINADDTVTYTPNTDFTGNDSFSYDVCDDGGLCDTATVTVTVTEGQPMYYMSVDSSTSLPGIAETVTDEDIVVYDATSGTWELYFDASDVGIASSDLDAFHIRGDGSILLSYSSDGLAIPGMTGGPEGELVDESDLFLFTPTSTGENTAGAFSFYFDASDVGLEEWDEDIVGVFEFDDGSLGITVKGDFEVAGLPAGGSEDIYRFTGTFGATTTGSWSLHFDGSDVGFTASDNFNGIFHSGDLYFTTEPGYSAAGGSGTDEDISKFVGTFGDTTTGTATLELDTSAVGLDPALTVDGLHVGNIGVQGPANTSPVASDDSYSTSEDVELSVGAPGVLGNDTDGDGDPLSASLDTGPSNGTVVLNSDGSFTYTPDADFNGSDSFAYEVSDGVASDTGLVSLTVDPVNDAPVADAGTDQSGTVGVTVMLDGSGSFDVDGDPLTYSWVLTAPSGSAASLDDPSSVTPQLTPDVAGDYVAELVVNDGTVSSVPDSVTVTVTESNTSPVASDDSYSTSEDVELSVGAPGVLGNDTDGDGDPLSASLDTGPSNGTVVLNSDGSFTYTPDADFNGSDSFAYEVSDGVASDTGLVSLTVDPVNDAPVASDDSYSTSQDAVLSVAAPGVLGNDSDVDGDSLSSTVNTGPSNGSLSLNEDGSFTYTPNQGFSGSDSFTYDASDGALTDNATVAITVNAVNAAPVASDDSYSTSEDVELSVGAPGVLGNDTDGDGDPLSASLDTGPSNGTVVLNSDGSFTYTPDADFNGSDSFAYEVSDGVASDTGLVSLTVDPVNDAPVASDDTFATGQDTQLAVSAPGVLENDTDADGDSLTVDTFEVTSASGGAVSVAADGSFTYDPPAGFTGQDSFTYTTTDGNLVSNTATVTITVGDTAIDQVAVSETTSLGLVVSGDLTSTTTEDGVSEEIEEESTNGNPRNRISQLRHEWMFDVEPGSAVVLTAVASRTGNSEGDDFHFEYSTDGGLTFVPAFVVDTSTLSSYEAALPSDTNGQVIVRVVDTDRTSGRSSLDRVTVDALIITTSNPQAELPAVSVTTSDANASETGDPGQIVFTRDISDSSLTVTYLVDGTADNGIDYETIQDTVTFPTGVDSVSVDIIPIDDAIAEGEEVVSISLTDGPGYTIGLQASAFVSIADDDLIGGVFRATSETTTYGSITTGDYSHTYLLDGDVEAITEELYAGNGKTRLEHTWTFSDISGAQATVTIDAQPSGSEAFVFAYSLDGSSWVEITSGASFSLNGATTVFVRVQDTDSSRGDVATDSILVDRLLITTS